MSFEQLYYVLISGLSAFGLFGYVVLMIVQAIVAPIPSELILIFGGATFGAFTGGLIGGVGEVLGGVVSFYISKKGGRPIVEKLLGKKVLGFADDWFKVYGGRAVLLGRLTPFIPFDAISYGAGLTKISFNKFLLATVVGGFPRAFFYSFLGGYVHNEVQRQSLISAFNKIGVIILFILLGVLLLQRSVERSVRKKIKKS